MKNIRKLIIVSRKIDRIDGFKSLILLGREKKETSSRRWWFFINI